jgi:hypothetical protein
MASSYRRRPQLLELEYYTKPLTSHNKRLDSRSFGAGIVRKGGSGKISPFESDGSELIW